MPRCIVYVPGSSQHFFKQSAEIIAERLVACIRHEIRDRHEFRYRIEVTADDADFSTEIPADVASIQCNVDGHWVTALKIIEIKYLEAFSKPFAGMASLERGGRAGLLLRKPLTLFLSILFGLFWPSSFRPESPSPKTRLDKLQAFYLSCIIGICFGFMVYWISVGVLALAGVTSLGNESFSLAFIGLDSVSLASFAAAVGGVTLGGLALKSRLEGWEKSAIEFYSIIRYLSDPGQSSGALNAIIEAVGNAHRSEDCSGVDVVCFSLGAMLTCDAVFPRRKQLWSPAPSITDLITIGHPYDLVVSLFPDYYEARQPPAMTYGRWMNVCTTDDFLGSNFRNDEEIGPQARPQLGIDCDGGSFIPNENVRFDPPLGKAKEKSWYDLLPFRRVGNHGLYWDGNDPSVPNCFQQIVQNTGWVDDVVALIRAESSTTGLRPRSPAKQGRHTT